MKDKSKAVELIAYLLLVIVGIYLLATGHGKPKPAPIPTPMPSVYPIMTPSIPDGGDGLYK